MFNLKQFADIESLILEMIDLSQGKLWRTSSNYPVPEKQNLQFGFARNTRKLKQVWGTQFKFKFPEKLLYGEQRWIVIAEMEPTPSWWWNPSQRLRPRWKRQQKFIIPSG